MESEREMTPQTLTEVTTEKQARELPEIGFKEIQESGSFSRWQGIKPKRLRQLSAFVLLPWGVLAAVIVWAYWAPLWGLALRWWKEADYGHGFFVPVFSGVLLLIRWKDWEKSSFCSTPSSLLVGLLLLLAAWFCRYVAHAYYVRLLEPASIIPALAGVALVIGGWNGLGWSWPAITFLIFMIPLPGGVADALRHPLQRISTVASTYILQVVGIPAVSRGNIIVLTDGELGVVEACSGLRMMVLFFAVCVGAAFVVRRPLLDRILMVLSAPVIAVAANVFRISVTGVLHELTTPELADFVFHDLAGWLMAPVALALLWGELWWLDRAFVPVKEEVPVLPLAAREKPEVIPPKSAVHSNPGGTSHRSPGKKVRKRRRG